MKEPWIAFEGLGIVLEDVQKGFDITIHWYGVLIAIGFLLAVILGLRACKKFGLSQDDVLTYILIAIPAAVVGARLYFVAFKWEVYANNLKEIFNIRNGGLAIYGGIIAALLATAIATKVRKQSFLNLMDFAMPYVLIGQAIGRWGNFINQEAYGKVTTLPWGMTGSGIPEGSVHPYFFYESMWCLVVFGLIMLYRSKWWKNTGELACLYFAGYGVGRSIFEYIRGDDALLIGNQRVSFWLSIALVLVFGGAFVYLRFIKKGEGVKVGDAAAVLLEQKTKEEAAKALLAVATAEEAKALLETLAAEEEEEEESTSDTE